MYLYRLLLKFKRKLPVIKRLSNGMFSVMLLAILMGSLLLVQMGTRSSVNEDIPYSIFILAGQSNAEGTQSYRFNLEAGTGLDKANHPADTETGFWMAHPSDYKPGLAEIVFNQIPDIAEVGWNDTGNTMVDLNYVQPHNQFGGEIGASRAMYDMGRRKVVFLKVTYGFQPLAEASGPFTPTDWNVNSENKSYDRLKQEFNELTTYITNEGSTYTVDGFFWMQGGTDTLQESMADAYEDNFRDLVNSIKTDFQLHTDARIVAGLPSLHNCVRGSYPLEGSYCGGPYARAVSPSIVFNDVFFAHPLYEVKAKTVRDAIQTVANEDDRVEVVDTKDLPRAWDWIHLNHIGQITFGQRLVNMYSLPQRFDLDDNAGRRTDYDLDGITNADEDTGRGPECVDDYPYETANNGNLGDDDTDCDGYPNYLDALDDEIGSGL